MPQATIISELMQQPLFSVGAGATVAEVEALAQSQHIHHVPIVQRGKLVGIVCTCDLRSARPNLRALQLARRQVVTARPDASVAEVARLMVENEVGSVVISNQDGLWGIVTRNDLAKADADLAQMLAPSHCSACNSSHHLRQGPGDTMLCVTCAERASSDHWYDHGGGD